MKRIEMALALLLAAPAAAHAQGLMSGTGLQPSTQVATPPSTPAIDRPGAAARASANRKAAQRRSETRSGRANAGNAPSSASTAPK